jgi:hypothetical protein
MMIPVLGVAQNAKSSLSRNVVDVFKPKGLEFLPRLVMDLGQKTQNRTLKSDMRVSVMVMLLYFVGRWLAAVFIIFLESGLIAAFSAK